MSKYQRLPEVPLYGALAKTDEDSLETKKVWTNRLLYLLDTPLATTDLSRLPAFEDLQEQFNIEGMTLGDLIHMQQIIRASMGDTKAYSAISKVAAQQKDNRKTHDLVDPLVKMVDMLHAATSRARSHEMFDDEMFGDSESIIEVQVIESHDEQDGSDD